MCGSLFPVDVICQHCTDGSVYPIKIRVTDEDGETQVYMIREYRDISGQGSYSMPDGVHVSNDNLVYECKITNFGQNRLIRLYYEPYTRVWSMTVQM